ncbi:MAG: molybdopterin-dependent oxidoreductase [Pseudomonadota bacterium]
MNKRSFLFAGALAGVAPGLGAAAAQPARGPALLTVTGAIGKSNRGPFDPVSDQMMAKQKLHFDKAYAFDHAALAALPALTIKPTLEYDAKVHTLSGPLLLDLVAATGARVGENSKLTLRAVDGYAVAVSVAQLRAQRFIAALRMDGQAMGLGGLGPVWAVYDADRVPDMAAKPLAERFGNCPWALYHIDVQA